MKYLILLLLLAILYGCGITESVIEQEEESYYTIKKDNDGKVVVCHKTGNGDYSNIEIAQPALKAHLNHGDGQPGDDVADKEGFLFDEDCNCIPKGPCEGVSSVDYEGQLYNTVEIGDQCWLKENLNVGTRINGSQEMSNNNTIEKYCYNDDDFNCDEYGGLYQWEEAMQYSADESLQGICPEGWHVPSRAELSLLRSYAKSDSRKLLDEDETAEANNETKFSAKLAGHRITWSPFYDQLKNYAFIWSSSAFSNSYKDVLYFGRFGKDIYINNIPKQLGFSIRCIKN